MLRKTKIVCTLGPASSDLDTIKNLMQSGLDAARINFSHGDYKSHTKVINTVKKAREELEKPIALLLDTKGPEIRTKTLKTDSVELIQGETFTLTTRDIEGDDKIVSVTYETLNEELHVGARVLMDDGLIELKVREINGQDIVCEVINAGVLGNRKGINIPEVSIAMPALTEKDIEDIKFGIEMGFDYIAASFIRSANDIRDIKATLEEFGGTNIDVIAKIENREGVDNIEEILEAADGIMVARGDLGVEIPTAEVPQVQKLLIKKANLVGKPVITATQMLESMTVNPRPTRAEANDVANAIYDGTDCIMLSGETAKGKYPVQAVQTMSEIALQAEAAIPYMRNLSKDRGYVTQSVTNAISFATITAASDVNAACIVPVTTSGFSARMVSRFRPEQPIVAVTEKENTWRKLNLTWGCVPVLTDKFQKGALGEVFDVARQSAQEIGVAKNGDAIVIVAGVPVGMVGTTNTLKIEVVGDILLRGKSKGGLRGVVGVANVMKENTTAKNFKQGDILVVSHTNDEMLPVMKKASAIIVGNGIDKEGEHAHTETVGKTLGIPVIVCLEKVEDLVTNGSVVTIDAKKGYVYNGVRESK